MSMGMWVKDKLDSFPIIPLDEILERSH